MAKYTTELRTICESLAGLVGDPDENRGYDSIDEIIESARPHIFDFTYPLTDTTHKAELETKIIQHYYTREIGSETYGLWHLRLKTTMQEIMPYYDELYNTAHLILNPLHDVDMHRESTKEIDGNYSGSESLQAEGTINQTGAIQQAQTNNSGEWNLYEDTPQGSLNNIKIDPNETTQSGYLTNARHITSSDSGTNNQQSVNNGTSSNAEQKTNSKTDDINESFDEHIYGKQGSASFAALLKEYRETILNIDMMIIEELNNLFMLIW